MTRPTLLAILFLAGSVAALYGYRLSDSPIYLTPDEVVIGLDAHTLSATGRDLRGRVMPLYFQIDEFPIKGTIWYQPVIMYATAALLTVAPLTAWAIRTPAVIVAVVSVVLMFVLARRLFRDTSGAVVATALLALAPAHFIHSRFAMDYIYPVPFILGWLCALAAYLDRPHSDHNAPRLLVIAGLCLGAGFYSYISAIALMPLYLVLTVLVVTREGRPGHLRYAAAGFGALLTLFVTWFAFHTGVFADTFARYDLGSSERIGLLDRFEQYWQYFGPSFLFFNGGSQLVFSTRMGGVFPLVALVLLPIGAIAVLRRPSPIRLVIGAGLLTAPVPALMLDEGGAINRALAILPFGVLLAATGFDAVTSGRPALRRAVAAIVVVVSLAQFAMFQRDYYGDYRARSASWFQYDIRGGLAAIVERTQGGSRPVYFDDGIRWVDLYWKFHLTAANRLDLLASTRSLTHVDRQVPAGSLLMIPATEQALAEDARLAIRNNEFRLVREISEPDGTISFMVLER
jgi:4-amino-4-deoxy-L-arabinose transferase-like glycosyltransferase